MAELFTTLMQIACAIGLVYGMIMMVRYWTDTIPEGGNSDGEFANHPLRRAGQ